MSTGAELIVLGTAQDGGLPHAGCRCENCERARHEPDFARLPASVGIVSAGATALVDATSGFEQQIYRLQRALAADTVHAERFAPPATIVLTHAHTGHYVGLWQLDRSVLAARGVRVLGTPRMIDFLGRQEPWGTMQREGYIALVAQAPDEAIDLLPGVRVTLLPVPHRSEWGVDTVALRIQGPNRTVLYLPDIDSWEVWERDIAALVADVDVALLDGCFWEPFHIPGVPHPPILETMRRLAPVVEHNRTRVVFTHLNHSNRVCDPASAEAAEALARGFSIADEGERIGL